MTKIMESIVCRNYYDQPGTQPTSERSCKIEPVQSELAAIRGYQQLFDCLASILVAVPFGLLADKYGKKRVLLLAMSGLTVARIWIQAICWWSDFLPLRLSWFSSLSLLLGGGNLVAGSLIYAIIADVTAPEQRAATFLLTYAAVLVAEIVTTPAASVLMRYDPWVPVNIALVILILGTMLALIKLPETKSIPERTENEAGVEDSYESDGEAVASSEGSSILSQAKTSLQSWKNHPGRTCISKEMFALVMVSLTSNMDRTSQPFFLQYVSQRFDLPLSQAGLLMSYRAVFNLILLLIILPVAARVLHAKFHLAPEVKDLWLSRLSATAFLLGTILIAIVPNLALLCIGLTIFALGYGLSAMVHSLATTLVDPRHIAVLFNAMSVAETAGDLISGPLFASTFAVGQRLGEPWLGLFFLVMALFYLVAAVGLWAIRAPS
ncbi:major facilitator superfamily domain-containing protein [Aspergillus coremiiformis]|uniref:Major facilitator superfamily domain-containing protein n=1 Tax=Aspergillus coremiiformis TaxID=138285 RepID=A0A5N6Z7E6_9EURO|nr:major facilitator superfamily domain-containing protein [Aspergillus coremiiformis]